MSVFVFSYIVKTTNLYYSDIQCYNNWRCRGCSRIL